MRRGEVWWADLPKPVGRRPVLILTRSQAIPIRTSITIAELTRTIRNIPVEVKLGPEDGLPKSCVVNLDVISTIPKAVLTEPIASLTPAKLEEVETALKFALDLI